MDPILYWYPVDCLGKDEYGDDIVVREKGKITPYRLSEEPYEMKVETRGFSFHLIFGKQVNGMFLCIPNWNVGCDLASLSDRCWNMNSIMEAGRFDYEKSIAIVWALSSIGDLLKLLHR